MNSNDFNKRNNDSSKSKQTRKQADLNNKASKQEGSKNNNYSSILIKDENKSKTKSDKNSEISK